ncbi:MAG: serine/threonine protein kinase [Deltaproteobacteria bacterium]|nr:serine/threonine protein kinase [Deltaproteobacteria bacterium]
MLMRAVGNQDEGFDVDLGPTKVAAEGSIPRPLSVPPNTGAAPADETHLGRYKLLGLLGKGGMAEVFLATQDGPAGFQKTCVVKRIRRSLAEEPKFVDMFLREARVAARLNHPNIVQIFELGEATGPRGKDYFIAMEFLDGVSLHRAARRMWATSQSMPMEVALRAVADAALGLHHAHNLVTDGRLTPLVHRDVSPDNIMLTRDGVSKVLDFGIAKSTDIDEQTGTGEVKGKIPFMSPEQLHGEPLDGRSDLWSLGVTMYWLLTGRRPFDGPTEPMTIDAILRRAPARPRELNPLIPAPVEAIIMQLLERERMKRIATAAELSDRLLMMLGPAAGYSAAAQFAARAMQMQDADGSPLPSVLTIIAARPESTWLRRVDAGVAGDLERLVPETTPPGGLPPSPYAAPPREPSTGGTVTGIKTAELSKSFTPRVLPWAAAAGLLVSLAVAFVAVRSGVGQPAVEPVPAPPVAPPTLDVAEPAKAAASPPPVAAPDPQLAAAGDPAASEPRVAAGRRDERPSIRAVAPGRIQWRQANKSVGRGSGSIKVAKGTTQLQAVDTETGGVAQVSVTNGVADYGTVQNGTLIVRVRPWAEVSIGARKLGTTPIDPTALPAGSYTVKFVFEDKVKTRNVTLKPGQQAVITIDMRE